MLYVILHMSQDNVLFDWIYVLVFFPLSFILYSLAINGTCKMKCTLASFSKRVIFYS